MFFMGDIPQVAALADAKQAEQPVIYKAYEYAKISSDGEFFLVREYRTLYHLDGRVSHEVLLMETPFEQLVRAFDGDVRKSGGLLTGFFNAPGQASECARKIDDLYGKPVDISGNQISMALSPVAPAL